MLLKATLPTRCIYFMRHTCCESGHQNVLLISLWLHHACKTMLLGWLLYFMQVTPMYARALADNGVFQHMSKNQKLALEGLERSVQVCLMCVYRSPSLVIL